MMGKDMGRYAITVALVVCNTPTELLISVCMGRHTDSMFATVVTTHHASTHRICFLAPTMTITLTKRGKVGLEKS